jgi:dipeptidyl aminopeptidase/acylaminoacyl peptidase
MIRAYSNETRVNSRTPPTFLVHASDDDGVPPANSLIFYKSLLSHQVSAEMHLYQSGGHGFGMNNPSTRDQWMDRCQNWLESLGLLPKTSTKARVKK